MGSKNSRTITLTLPEGLLVQIDVLAKLDFATRSDVLRQAALAYVRQSDLDVDEVTRLAPNYSDQRPKPKPETKPKREYDYEKLVKKYPYVHGDRQLLEFLDDYYQGRL